MRTLRKSGRGHYGRGEEDITEEEKRTLRKRGRGHYGRGEEDITEEGKRTLRKKGRGHYGKEKEGAVEGIKFACLLEINKAGVKIVNGGEQDNRKREGARKS